MPQIANTTMRSRILPDDPELKPILSKKTNALLASWDRRRGRDCGQQPQQQHGSIIAPSNTTCTSSMSPRHPHAEHNNNRHHHQRPYPPRLGSHKDKISSSVWTVKLPKKMLYTILGIFLAIPLLIFFWKEIHSVSSAQHQHDLLRHHRDHLGNALSPPLSDMDRLKATWMADAGGEDTPAVTVPKENTTILTKAPKDYLSPQQQQINNNTTIPTNKIVLPVVVDNVAGGSNNTNDTTKVVVPAAKTVPTGTVTNAAVLRPGVVLKADEDELSFATIATPEQASDWIIGKKQSAVSLNNNNNNNNEIDDLAHFSSTETTGKTTTTTTTLLSSSGDTRRER
jgi:hypothetical protein